MRIWNAPSAKKIASSANVASAIAVRNKGDDKAKRIRSGESRSVFYGAQTFVSAPSPTTVIHSRTRQDVTTPWLV